MTSNRLFVTIRNMKTDFRRWWIINRLYHFIDKKGEEWVRELEFWLWINGVDVFNPELNLSEREKDIYNAPLSKLHFIIMMRLFFKRDWNDMVGVINECIDPVINWIDKETDIHGLDKIKLSTRGKGQYALSSFLVYLFHKYWQLAILLYTATISVTIYIIPALVNLFKRLIL